MKELLLTERDLTVGVGRDGIDPAVLVRRSHLGLDPLAPVVLLPGGFGLGGQRIELIAELGAHGALNIPVLGHPEHILGLGLEALEVALGFHAVVGRLEEVHGTFDAILAVLDLARREPDIFEVIARLVARAIDWLLRLLGCLGGGRCLTVGPRDIVGRNLGDLRGFGRGRCCLWLLVLRLLRGVELLVLDRLLLASVDVSDRLLLLLRVGHVLLLLLWVGHVGDLLGLLSVASADHARDASTLEQTGPTEATKTSSKAA